MYQGNFFLLVFLCVLDFLFNPTSFSIFLFWRPEILEQWSVKEFFLGVHFLVVLSIMPS